MVTVHRASLRPQPTDPPIAAATVGDATIVAIASAWGAWCGPAAEQPAVTAALARLAAAAPTATDWPAELLQTFAALPAHLDPLVDPGDELGLDPVTCLTCAVLTPAAITIAWCGSLLACRVAAGRFTAATEPHTLARQLRSDPNLPADALAELSPALAGVTVRSLGPTHLPHAPPELARWPPLAAGESLLLADHRVVELLRAAPPPPDLRGEAWLRAALNIDRDPDHPHRTLGDRIGALAEAADTLPAWPSTP